MNYQSPRLAYSEIVCNTFPTAADVKAIKLYSDGNVQRVCRTDMNVINRT